MRLTKTYLKISVELSELDVKIKYKNLFCVLAVYNIGSIMYVCVHI